MCVHGRATLRLALLARDATRERASRPAARGRRESEKITDAAAVMI